jgi:transposase-like protein
MAHPSRARRRFTALQNPEAMELCLQEGLSCNAVAERLGLPSSSLARWVSQACIDCGQAGPRDQGLLNSEQRAEFSRLRKENRELRREKDLFRLPAAHFAKEQLPPRGFARSTDVDPGNESRLNERPRPASLGRGLEHETHQAHGGADHPEALARRASAQQCTADQLITRGKTVAEVCRVIEVTEPTDHRWRQQYGGLQAEETR